MKRKKFASVKNERIKKEIFEINVLLFMARIKGTLPFFQKKGWKTLTLHRQQLNLVESC